VIDTKTMNFVKYENVKIVNEKLYHTSYKDVRNLHDFATLKNCLFPEIFLS